MKNYLIKVLFLLFLLVLSLGLGLFGGGFWFIPGREIPASIFDLRLSRIIISAVCGASLAICGGLYQSILINPLAEPYLLGISAGAALGAVLAIWLGLPVFTLAISFALLALLLVFTFAYKKNHLDNNGLILSGVMVNAFCSALIMLIVTVAGSKVQALMFWLTGDLGSADLSCLWLIVPVLFCLICFSFIFNRSLDALAFGDEDAGYLGIDAHLLKLIVFILASFLIALLVANTGIIGFIGLIIPHIAKMLFGEQLGRALLPMLLLGAIFLVLADLLSRTIIPGTVLPVGIITAVIGVPFFVLVYKRS